MANLDYETTLAMIESGKILTDQIGNAPLWVVDASYRGFKRGQILVPNVTGGFFFVLDEMYSLLRQQGHIMDGYERNEIPGLGEVFEILVKISGKLGTQAKLTLALRAEVASELTMVLFKIKGHTGGKAEAKAQLLSAIAESAHRIYTTKTQAKVEDAIRFLVGRMEQIGTKIAPLIDRRRSAAFYEIAIQERQLWRIAYMLQTRAKTTAARNVTVALSRDLESMHIPKAQPFREQTMKARTGIRNASAAIRAGNPAYASHLLFCAIGHLGFEPQTLKQKPRNDL